MIHQNKFLVITSTAIAYFLLYQLNFLLIGESLNYAHRVDWIFLPSGLRFAFVLIFLLEGALGIALASMFITYQQYFDGDYLNLIISGSLAGIGPYLAWQLATVFLNLDREMRNLSSIGLFKLAAFFALISAIIHQLWYFWIGKNEQFLDALLVMFLGDLVGTIVVLGLLQIALRIIRISNN
jgi:hypothetical protein